MSDDIITNSLYYTKTASLYTGWMGTAIYHANLYTYRENPKYQHQVYDLVNKSLNNLATLQGKSSLSGYAGVVWGLTHLINIGLLAYGEIKSYLDKLKSLIIESLAKNISNKNFDLMHGLIGKLITLAALYELAPKDNSELPQIIDDNVLALTKMCYQNGNSSNLIWQSSHLPQGMINTGLAHGVASIIWFFASISEKAFLSSSTKMICTEQVQKTTKWLISQKTKFRHPHFCIPHEISLNNDKIITNYSLAWCRGDLGIAVALIKAGNVLRDRQLFLEGLAIAQSISKLSVKNSNITLDKHQIDSSLCHGTFGVFFIFYQLYGQTSDSNLKKAYLYWLDVSLDLIKPDEKFCGLHTYLSHSEQGIVWNQNVSLLNGVSGIALILLTYLMQEQGVEQSHPWFDIFL